MEESGKAIIEECRETPSQAQAKPFVIGHPKMEKLQEIVLDHFNTHSDATTRVMIFSQYRDSVQEITDMLHVHQPVIKVMSFIGQATAGKSTKGFTQKEQLMVMKQFREGGYNTLVSTCVGEEGLDIGDVDLIICFDAHKSPIRLVQRMGRTGRKREGRIVMLVTKGKEEQIYNQSQYSKKSIHKAILNGAKSLHFYQHSPRMLPDNVTPTCHKMHITVKENFKPTKKIMTDKVANQSKITSMMSDVSSKKEQSGEVITLEEYKELEPWLIPEEDIPKLPACKTMCLEKTETAKNHEETGKFLSLSEWSPWQTTLQQTIHIDHSRASRHLVQLMEFIQLQQSLDPDDDPYGLEMAAYLNEEDIIQPGEKDSSSVARICVSKKKSNQKNIDENDQINEGRVKSRRSDNLPSFDFLDGKARSSSDEDLPEFNVEIDSEKGNKVNDQTDLGPNRKSSTCRRELEDSNLKSLGNDGSEFMHISEENMSNSDDEGKNRETSKKLGSGVIRKPFISKAKSLEKRMSVAKFRKKKKSRHSSGQTSVIQPIADSDSNDFDGVPQVSINVSEEPHNFSDISKENKNAKPSCMNTESFQIQTGVCDREFNSEIRPEISCQNGRFRICSPPPLEEVRALCKALDDKADFKNFDLFAAINKWHTENKSGKYIVYPKNMISETVFNCCQKTKFTSDNLSGQISDEEPRDIISDEAIERNHPTVVSVTDKPGSLVERTDLKNKDCDDFEVISNNVHTVVEAKMSALGENIENDIGQESETKGKIRSDKMKLSEKSAESAGRKLSEENDDDDIMCTGNFMLNADDVFSSNDDWEGEEMKEAQESNKCNNDSFKKKYDSPHEKDNSAARELVENDIKSNNTKHSFVDLGSRDSLNSSNESATSEVFSVPFTHVNKTNYDSFLADDKDDEILMDIKTPLGNKAHETSTQITFTQALNFVNSGSRTSSADSFSENRFKDMNEPSRNKSWDKKQNPKFCLPNSSGTDKNQDNLILEESKSENDTKDGNNYFDKSDCESKTNKFEKVTATKSSSSSDDGIEMPEFDLGFDFDEDIIPPSPKASQTSQRQNSNRLSQTFAFTNRLSQSRCLANEFSSGRRDQINCNKTEQHFDQKSSGENVLNRVNKNNVSLNEKEAKRVVLDKCLHDNEDDSQSILGETTLPVVHVRHKHKARSLMDQVSKSKLDPVLENDEFSNVCEAFVHQSKTTMKREQQQNADVKLCQGGENAKRLLAKENDNLKLDNVDNNLTGEFDTSFALLGEDLDDWINGGAESEVKMDHNDDIKLAKDTENKGEERSMNYHDSLPASQKSTSAIQTRPGTPVAVVGPFHFSQEGGQKFSDLNNQSETQHSGTNKHIRKSMFTMRDLLQDSFDDSFSFTSQIPLDKKIPKANGITSLPRHNTSTPMSKMNKSLLSVTQALNDGASPTIARSNFMDSTPIKVNSSKVAKPVESVLNRSDVQGHNQSVMGSPFAETYSEDDDSFIVRRKKKVQILDSPLTQKERKASCTEFHGNNESNNDYIMKLNERKTLSSPFSNSDDYDDNFDDSLMLTQKNYVVQKSSVQGFNQSSDEDFEDNRLQIKKQTSFYSSKKKIQTSEKSKVSEREKIRRDSNRKRTSNPFIEDEAEISEEADSDVSSDEHEGSDLDAYEGSFIADSQFSESQALNQTDVHALYLKSVKSPQPLRGRFKLQYNHKTDVNVFSQAPPPEESHYMEDSFCVGSEEEDSWLLREEGESDDEPKEITLLQNYVVQTGRKRRRGLQAFQTSRQREIQIGRMKALSEIRSKLAGKAAGRVQQQKNDQLSNKEDTVKRNSAKRNRIHIESDSSSDEKNKFHMKKSDLMSPSIKPVANRNKRQRRVLSSDDSESEEFYNESRSMCRSNTSVHVKDRHKPDSKKVNVKTSFSSTINIQTAEELRQERLKKQKEKQSEFRKLMEEKQTACSDNLTRIKEKSDFNYTVEDSGLERFKSTSDCKTDTTDLLICSSVRKSKFSDKPVILVDSKEISGSQDIISDLRFKHDIVVSAAQLSGCDYIVSNRMAVERKQWSEFSNGANRTKLIERMQHLGELYDRPCLIVEKDRVKPGEEKSTRPVHWTKYTDRTLALLIRSEIKVLFTDNCTETAETLADLCQLEQRKDMGINVPVELNEEQLSRLKFYISFPKLSYIHALNLCEGFKSVTKFLNADVVLIEKLGKMSRNRAAEVYNYKRRKFDSNMLPSSYK